MGEMLRRSYTLRDMAKEAIERLKNEGVQEDEMETVIRIMGELNGQA